MSRKKSLFFMVQLRGIGIKRVTAIFAIWYGISYGMTGQSVYQDSIALSAKEVHAGCAAAKKGHRLSRGISLGGYIKGSSRFWPASEVSRCAPLFGERNEPFFSI